MQKSAGADSADKTIIVRLLGGLGNQMFQYALGRQLSITRRATLKLDVGFYKNWTNQKWANRSYSLSHFNINAAFADEADLRPFSIYLQPNIVSKLLRRASAWGLGRRGYIFEPLGRNFSFDGSLLTSEQPKTIYLDGFWQTEKYFSAVEDVIRKDFTFKDAPDAVNQKMLEEIGTINSVALHVRHGDNATKAAAYLGVLPLDYYERAVADLASLESGLKFFIFSDDPAWVKKNLRLNHPCVFVDHNGDEKNYEDMRLMAACRHHIIGNSTFSWWGAWLGKKPGQRVYAPEKYYMNANILTADFYPAG